MRRLAAMRLRLRDGDHWQKTMVARFAGYAAAMRLRLRDGDHKQPAAIRDLLVNLMLQCGSVSGTEITGPMISLASPTRTAQLQCGSVSGTEITEDWYMPALPFILLQCGSVSGTEITASKIALMNANVASLQCGSVSGTEITRPGGRQRVTTRSCGCNAAPSQGRRSRA